HINHKLISTNTQSNLAGSRHRVCLRSKRKRDLVCRRQLVDVNFVLASSSVFPRGNVGLAFRRRGYTEGLKLLVGGQFPHGVPQTVDVTGQITIQLEAGLIATFSFGEVLVLTGPVSLDKLIGQRLDVGTAVDHGTVSIDSSSQLRAGSCLWRQ